jgi:1-deoxyxylulose-5-phosphate synthase
MDQGAVQGLGVGCNNFGSFSDERAADEVVSAALALGVGYFDTADAYPPGSQGLSERILGAVLKGRRDKATVATKFGFNFGSVHGRGDAAFIRSSLEGSLSRLGTDYVDVYQLHRPTDTPIGETLSVLADLVREGKVRRIGCSNFSGEQVIEAETAARELGLPGFATNQINMSVLAPNEAVHESCTACGVDVIPYFVLGSGLLTGKYRIGSLPEVPTRLTVASDDPIERRFADVWSVKDYLPVVEQLARFAEGRGHTLAELAFGWLCVRPGVAVVLAGATSGEQVERNVRSFGAWRPGVPEVEQMEEIVRSLVPRKREGRRDVVPEFSRRAAAGSESEGPGS